MSRNRSVTIDVRDDIRRGREPFSKIMQAVAGLGDGQDLVLLAPFEPTPLYAMLAQRGFSHQAHEVKPDDWEVRFSRQPQVAAAPPKPAKSEVVPQAVEFHVDARGLEPPQPLVRILEAVADLPAGATLVARTDRRPMHLYAQLEERGFCTETEETAEGSFITYVRRK